jgi:hypothetical protein
LQGLRYAEAAEYLSRAQCARVEELTLGKAVTKTPWQLRQLLRKTVVRVGAEDFAKRHREAKKTSVGFATYFDDATGMGEIFARLTAVDAKIIETGVEAWARAAKASGDERSLDELRAAALVEFTERYLRAPDGPRAHGRPVVVNIAWDFLSFLGLTDHPGEILGTGAMIPAAALRDLIPHAALSAGSSPTRSPARCSTTAAAPTASHPTSPPT